MDVTQMETVISDSSTAIDSSTETEMDKILDLFKNRLATLNLDSSTLSTDETEDLPTAIDSLTNRMDTATSDNHQVRKDYSPLLKKCLNDLDLGKRHKTFINRDKFNEKHAALVKACLQPPGLHLMYYNFTPLIDYYFDMDLDGNHVDPNFTYADVLIFVDTRMIPRDNICFQNHILISEIVSDTNERKPGGISVYMRSHLFNDFLYADRYPNIYDTGVHRVDFYIKSFKIVVLYVPPDTCMENIQAALIECLDSEGDDTILVGNFNVDMNSEQGSAIQNYLAEEYKLSCEIDNETLIDPTHAVFTDMKSELVRAGTYKKETPNGKSYWGMYAELYKEEKK